MRPTDPERGAMKVLHHGCRCVCWRGNARRWLFVVVLHVAGALLCCGEKQRSKNYLRSVRARNAKQTRSKKPRFGATMASCNFVRGGDDEHKQVWAYTKMAPP